MLKKMLLIVGLCNAVLAYDVSKRKGPVAGVLINRKVASAKQSLLNRRIALENGDQNVLRVMDDEACVNLTKTPFVKNTLDDNRYNKVRQKKNKNKTMI